MATKRQKAYQDVLNREPKHVEYDGKLSDLFGQNVFHVDVMREYLPSETYKYMMESIHMVLNWIVKMPIRLHLQ
jgi:glutamine synthetase